MTSHTPTRDEAFALLSQFTKNEALVKHGLAVEAIMRHFARTFGEDEEAWGIVGLVHDIDYEQYPDQHCAMSRKILSDNNWPEEYIRAVVSHGWGMFTDAEPQTNMEKVLYAVDELSGLIIAAALVRPSRSLMDLEPSSVKKKWKDKAFAAGVDRSIIERGAAMLKMELPDLIRETILAMRPIEKELGLGPR
jgi:putative nucleotidyltransferase with HDIG domain